MPYLLLPALLCLLPQEAPPPPARVAAPVTTTAVPAKVNSEARPLGFASFRLPYTWNATIPIKEVALDGLKVNAIAFSKRKADVWPLKEAEFGTRATLEVTNTADKPRTPGFAVAVFDDEDRLLGVATGGTKLGSVRPGNTESFDLNFHQVLERLPKGHHFHLSIELTD
jgi:hypothetical protein